jgi:Na+/H+ antiporter NhaC
LTLIFVIFIAYTGKDFGPMLIAEKKSSLAEKPIISSEAIPETYNNQQSSSLNAVLPILTLIVTIVMGILLTGKGDSVADILGSADSLAALLFGGFLGSIVAIILTLYKKIMSLEETMNSWLNGLNNVVSALVILVLSWSLAEITKELNTANYLATLIGDGIYPALFPAVVFVLAGVISLGTGTSWGTMGILMPLVIPVSWSLVSAETGFVAPSDLHIIYSSISCVLAGAVWGDHCSPISDTTILSSMASQCNHIEHVRTQMPYAIVVAFIALISTVVSGLGLPWWLVLAVSCIILWFGLNLFGKSAEPINSTIKSVAWSKINPNKSK